MQQVSGPNPKGQNLYRSTSQCALCPLLNQCLTAKQQHKTSQPQPQLQINPAAHQRALRRRRFASEGLFGHLNTYHNGDKTP